MKRIEKTFSLLREKSEKALVLFLTAGDPDMVATEVLVPALAEAGADIIELGFPFSDPMADGPIIQASSERALKGGATLKGILAGVRRIRQKTAAPIVLMGYYNPVFCYGLEAFARDAAEAGVDGLLTVDLPPEEAGELRRHLRNHGLAYITLVAPITPAERAEKLVRESEGYVYYVSMTGVTGSREIKAEDIEEEVSRLKGLSSVPVAVGFGISTPADVEAVAGFADGVVVGSALVKIIAAGGPLPEVTTRAAAFARDLKQGTR
jgi:tryptophan synthase alpha chain